jgi:hypothetical protein
MQELDLCRKVPVFKPEGTRHVAKPKLGRLEAVEENIKKMGLRNWRRE